MKPAPVGAVFGHFTILGEGERYIIPSNGRPMRRWRAQCVCGAERLVFPGNLYRNNHDSCGCVVDWGAANRKHETCTYAGCDQPHAAHGLCQLHLYRQKHNVPMDGPEPWPDRCTEADCDRESYALGLCHRHHTKDWRRRNREKKAEATS